jgi:hypothetical protein
MKSVRDRRSTDDYTDRDAVREADEARALRARRDAELSPTERLERVHELCRQLAAIRLIGPRER